MDGVEFLRRRYARDHIVTTAGVESVQKLRLPREARVVSKVIYDDQNLEQLSVTPLLEEVCDFMLCL